MLDREEYIEQAFFFRTLRERLGENIPLQDLLVSAREEILATTKLPLAIDFLRTELLHRGVMAPAMRQLGHYFSPFQAYVVEEAESDRSRFDLRVGLEILQREAEYKSQGVSRPGLFLYQFETLCRNRLKYDEGLLAMSQDPGFETAWRSWIQTVRRQVGLVDFADMIFVRSELYAQQQRNRGMTPELGPEEVLFGEREGRIAQAHRHREPLLMLAAFQRQLGYPAIPRPSPVGDRNDILPQLSRRIERLEQRLKLMEDESRDSIDLTRYYVRPPDSTT